MFLQWFKMQYKDVIIFAIPNGAQRSYQNAKYLVAEGLLAGVSDLFICKPSKQYGGMFLEFKIYPNVLSDVQELFIKKASKAGYNCVVAYSFEEAEKAVKDYFND